MTILLKRAVILGIRQNISLKSAIRLGIGPRI